MSTMIPFEFNSSAIRVIEIDGEPWFVGKDVAEALGYANATDAIKQHCKGVAKRYPLQTAGGSQKVRVLNEPDVLRLMISSTLPAAQEFEVLVFEVILPTIRKTGRYSAEQVSPEHQELRMKDHLTLQRKYIAVLDELEFYRRDAQKWETATAMIKAGVDNNTISTVLSVPVPYLEWVRCRAEGIH